MLLVTETNLGTMWEETTQGCDYLQLGSPTWEPTWGCLPWWSLPKHWYVNMSPISLSIGYCVSTRAFLNKAQLMITEAKISYTKMQYARNLINVFNCLKSVKQAILSILNKWRIRKVKQLVLSYKSQDQAFPSHHSSPSRIFPELLTSCWVVPGSNLVLSSLISKPSLTSHYLHTPLSIILYGF